MKHIIIGGVAGGATAAARIRRTDEKAEIFLLEKGKYISYANCGLPYYIGGTIAEREKLFMQTPASFAKRFNIDVRVENEVIGIDTTKKRVEVRRADGSTYTENYDKMLLSPGASPRASAFERHRNRRHIHAPQHRRYRSDQRAYIFAPNREYSHRRSRIHRIGDGREPAPHGSRSICRGNGQSGDGSSRFFNRGPCTPAPVAKRYQTLSRTQRRTIRAPRRKRSRFSSLPEKALQPI